MDVRLTSSRVVTLDIELSQLELDYLQIALQNESAYLTPITTALGVVLDLVKKILLVAGRQMEG